MRLVKICFCAALLLLSLTPAAWAHRLNVFAFVDGGEIQVECSFSRGNPARQGKVEISDAATNAALVTGVTGDDGVFRFPMPDGVRNRGHDLIVRVNAGEGHLGEWRIPAAELGRPSVDAVAVVRELQGAAAVPPSSAQDGRAISLTPRELEQIINAALEQKLAPIRQLLAEQRSAGAALRDIIGGIGWLMGLAGIAAYFKSRRS